MPEIIFFKYVKKKHGQDIITVMRSIEKTQRKFMKVSADIKYIKTCKKERLTPTFAKGNISLKSASFKPKWKIATFIMESEMQNKHSEKRKLKKELKQMRKILKRSLNLVILNAVFHQLHIALKSIFKVIANRHQKKITNLRKQQERKIDKSTTAYIKNTVHNFLSYQPTTEEYTALSNGLDHHIPCKFNTNRIHTECEHFYQSILKDISHIPENDLLCLKTKLRNTCEKYSKVHVIYKYKKVIDQLSQNKDLCILKHNKGRGVVLMDRTKYTKKCLELRQTDQFIKLNHDSTKSIEGKIQRILRKLKNRLSSKEYYQLYPAGSWPGKFYGTAKIHKLPPNGFIDNLPLRPIVPNIGTAS